MPVKFLNFTLPQSLSLRDMNNITIVSAWETFSLSLFIVNCESVPCTSLVCQMLSSRQTLVTNIHNASSTSHYYPDRELSHKHCH